MEAGSPFSHVASTSGTPCTLSTCIASHPWSSLDTVRIEPAVHAESESLHESDTSYTQPHTCFYTVYRHVSHQGMGDVQVAEDVEDVADAYTSGAV